MTRRRGDGFLTWLTVTVISGGFYAALAGWPSSLYDIGLLAIVPAVFGLFMTAVAWIGDRL